MPPPSASGISNLHEREVVNPAGTEKHVRTWISREAFLMDLARSITDECLGDLRVALEKMEQCRRGADEHQESER